MPIDPDGFEAEAEPRELTTEEVRERFLDHVRGMVRYRSDPKLKPALLGGESEIEARVSGVAFSILVALDGCANGLPGFIVAPDPHPDDREFRASEGENRFPENHGTAVKADIAGMLHDLFYPASSRPAAGVDADEHKGGADAQ